MLSVPISLPQPPGRNLYRELDGVGLGAGRDYEYIWQGATGESDGETDVRSRGVSDESCGDVWVRNGEVDVTRGSGGLGKVQ